MFIATIKTCTDEQTIIQRLFSTLEGASHWLDAELLEWNQNNPGQVSTPASPFQCMTQWRRGPWRVYYFVSALEPDNPNSELEWA